MKTILSTILLCVLALPTMAADDKSITLEFIWGIGGTTTHKGLALRVGQDNTEVHIARWFGPRSNTAVGFGVVARTEGDGQANNSFFNVSGQVGLSYVFKTNSVLSTHLQPYFRADGTADFISGGDVEIVGSYSRYGFLVAEQFGGIGLRINDRYEPTVKENIVTLSTPNDEPPPDDVPPGPPGDVPPGPPGDEPPPDDVPPGPPGDVPPGPPGDVPPGPPGDDDGNNGHGNNEDGCDDSNPGNGGPPSCNS